MLRIIHTINSIFLSFAGYSAKDRATPQLRRVLSVGQENGYDRSLAIHLGQLQTYRIISLQTLDKTGQRLYTTSRICLFSQGAQIAPECIQPRAKKRDALNQSRFMNQAYTNHQPQNSCPVIRGQDAYRKDIQKGTHPTGLAAPKRAQNVGPIWPRRGNTNQLQVTLRGIQFNCG